MYGNLKRLRSYLFLLASTGHPRAKDYATDEEEEVGQVIIVRQRKVRQIIKGAQFAAFFGAAVAFADIDADG